MIALAVLYPLPNRFSLDSDRAWTIPSCRYDTLNEGASMKIVVLLSQKGGTGKSTIATHLAVCAARDGKAVALFDIDPQASAADLDAIEDTITLAQRATQGKAAVVINAAPMRGHLAEDARAAISARIAVAPVTLGQRSAYANAWIDGRSVEEYDPTGKAADEIRALYRWMMRT